MTTPRLIAAYADTTALIPVLADEEPVREAVLGRLNRYQILLSANLLDAEVRSAATFSGQELDMSMLSGIRWIMPNRPLADEMAAIADIANLPAARLWHLAVALFFAELVPGLVFITLDEQQEAAARDLGLAVE